MLAPLVKEDRVHRFRKTFATKLHHGGTRLKDLQQWLGHKSMSTTKHYLAGSDLKAAHVRTQVDFVFDGNEIRGLEQNPDTKSRWAQMARSGKKVMQFLSGGPYVANVVGGKVTPYGRRRGTGR
jgi:integrase